MFPPDQVPHPAVQRAPSPATQEFERQGELVGGGQGRSLVLNLPPVVSSQRVRRQSHKEPQQQWADAARPRRDKNQDRGAQVDVVDSVFVGRPGGTQTLELPRRRMRDSVFVDEAQEDGAECKHGDRHNRKRRPNIDEPA